MVIRFRRKLSVKQYLILRVSKLPLYLMTLEKLKMSMGFSNIKLAKFYSVWNAHRTEY